MVAVIVENGVKLWLNIVDTSGHGDQVNNENWTSRTSAYLRKELYIQDTRIHCCLYFNPTGHSLRPIDINVVPVIAGLSGTWRVGV
ncbi:Septin-type guanine nucleotide-binding (G) domain-containing protein [Mycena pura]|uniref:Septin-type guanine nucleotide-binding (G) domain-containing protein n=1 Tax=Mycena pura TaxID=153505 RepID=A0AAD6YLR3_9AGAR|nr:Septin-type guanine nucleotide-binding (G) domain-containing protein [Mycena pura]